MSDDTLKDRIQILTTAQHLLGELQIASSNALTLAKTSLEGRDPKVLVSSNADVTIVRLGLDCLEQGRQGAEAAVRLSLACVELKEEIEEQNAGRSVPDGPDGG